MLSKHCVETRHGNELTRNSLGIARPLSSQLSEPVLFDSWPKDWN